MDNVDLRFSFFSSSAYVQNRSSAESKHLSKMVEAARRGANLQTSSGQSRTRPL
jgi:hypothetical protein